MSEVDKILAEDEYVRWRRAFLQLERDFLQHADWLNAYGDGLRQAYPEAGWRLQDKACCQTTGLYATLRAVRKRNNLPDA